MCLTHPCTDRDNFCVRRYLAEREQNEQDEIAGWEMEDAMSFVQRIYLSTSPYKNLLPVDERRLFDISELDFLPKSDMGEVEFIGATLSLVYAEFHKAYELHEIIEQECSWIERERHILTWFELESVISNWRDVIDKQTNKETKQYWLEIERKLSDLYTFREVIDKDLWSIEYEGEA